MGHCKGNNCGNCGKKLLTAGLALLARHQIDIEKGPAERDSAIDLADSIERDEPETAREIRVAVERRSTVEEIGRRYSGRRPQDPTEEEIQQRAAEVRRGWVDGSGVLISEKALSE